MAMAKRRIIRKVCLLGDGAVGKTSLVRRFVEDVFDDKYLMTFGTKVTKKALEMGEVDLTLMIWDVLGQKGTKSLQSAYYRGANGAILVCDITRPESIRNLTAWKEDLQAIVGETPVVLVANKCDLGADNQQVLDEIGRALGREFILTSALTGEGVEEAFNALARSILED
jgi:small GTP-binding protein